VLAAVVPAAPERAVVNAVLYRDAHGLEAAYEEVAAAFGEIGAKWTVWVRPGDDAAAALLGSRGHELDAQPWAMARRLDGVERPPADALADWTADGSLEDVGAINDRSYTFGTDSFSRALRELPDGAAHVYVARDGEGGAAVGCLVVLDHEGNSEIQMVAVVPEARGQGITAGGCRRARQRDLHVDRHASRLSGVRARRLRAARARLDVGTRSRLDQLDALLEHDLSLQHAVNGALRADLHEALALVLGHLLREVDGHAEARG